MYVILQSNTSIKLRAKNVVKLHKPTNFGWDWSILRAQLLCQELLLYNFLNKSKNEKKN